MTERRLSDDQYDLIVIGGGVQGICILLTAARRGLRTVLFERGDFAGATSWNSLRILHGGLRYLQHLDFDRSRSSVKAQRWWLDSFPELIEPLPCLMPLYERGLKRRSTMAIGLSLYQRLLAPHPHLLGARVLDVAETLDAFPGVVRERLSGGALWYDAFAPQSERLLIETLRWARASGGEAFNYMEARLRTTEDGIIDGVVAVDRLSGDQLECGAPVIVNATGPWLDRLGTHDAQNRLFEPSRAFNLLLDRTPPSSHALAVSATSPLHGLEHTCFLVPWQGRLYAGTYHSPIDSAASRSLAQPSDEEIEDFLALLNQAVPGLAARADEIASIRCGLLPASSPGTAKLSRHPLIREEPGGLLHVGAVKLTTAPIVAEKVVDRIRGRGDHRSEATRPAIIPLPQGQDASLLSDNELSEVLETVIETESVATFEDLFERRTSWSAGREAGALEARIASLMRSGKLTHLPTAAELFEE